MKNGCHQNLRISYVYYLLHFENNHQNQNNYYIR